MNDPLTAAQADRIARLFAEGRTVTQITLEVRCTRARVLHVAQQRGWQLVGEQLPRQRRPAVTPGKPVSSHPAGMGVRAPRRSTGALTLAAPLPGPRTPHGPAPKPKDVCREDGCPTVVRANGQCAMHYMRDRRAETA